jgi:hypothetical protein
MTGADPARRRKSAPETVGRVPFSVWQGEVGRKRGEMGKS